MAVKLGITEEEADESQFWLEMLVDTKLATRQQIQSLHREFGELLAMLIASRKTIRRRIERQGSKIRELRKPYPESRNGP